MRDTTSVNSFAAALEYECSPELARKVYELRTKAKLTEKEPAGRVRNDVSHLAARRSRCSTTRGVVFTENVVKMRVSKVDMPQDIGRVIRIGSRSRLSSAVRLVVDSGPPR